MKKNMGIADKVIRLILAATILIGYFTNYINGILAFILLALSGIFLLTSIISFCPLYFPFKINTRYNKKD